MSPPIGSSSVGRNVTEPGRPPVSPVDLTMVHRIVQMSPTRQGAFVHLKDVPGLCCNVGFQPNARDDFVERP
jgi:hypothetical protein